MKIIKRDGRVVDYDRKKIEKALEKANNEVKGSDKATPEELKNIVNYIEDLDKKRMLVEDIQDIIEIQLMNIKKFKLAKKYIVYRYTRALVRKQNTTDESILGLIRNQNSNLNNLSSTNQTIIASTQRNYIAGEVSKDLTKRLLLPENITAADETGVLYFHDADYFVQPIINSCIIDLENMLDYGTVINKKMIEQPKSFLVACLVTTQILANVSSNQYGGVSINISHLAKYLKKSYINLEKKYKDAYNEKINAKDLDSLINCSLTKELQTGIQIMQYQINMLITSNGKAPFVTYFLYLDSNDPYVEETAKIIEEILKQSYNGIKDQNGDLVYPSFPKLVYVLTKENSFNRWKIRLLNRTMFTMCPKKKNYQFYFCRKNERTF